MTTHLLLNETSLANTVWNLEEARWSNRSTDDPAVGAALSWVAGRIGMPGAYQGVLALPTESDISEHLGAPTGDTTGLGTGGVLHVLGEEAVHALLLWDHQAGWDSERTLGIIENRFRWKAVNDGAERLGHFCCLRCSVARWRALALGKPKGWEDSIADGLKMLAGQKVKENGRWERYPFYYTLLTLSEIPMDEVHTERARVAVAADRALSRLNREDQVTRFRRRALEWAVS